MRIGLLRHFPVVDGFPRGWRTSEELLAWLESYDRGEVMIGEFDLGGIEWNVCVASDLPRARVTAEAVFRGGEIELTSLLREGRFASFGTGRLRLPVKLWEWVLRVAWLTGHRTQRACRDELRERVRMMAERLAKRAEEERQDTLVVSHAGVMLYLSEELRRRGFIGPKMGIARHARVYVFDRKE